MLDRCSLKYPVVGYLASLDPRFIKDPKRHELPKTKEMLALCKHFQQKYHEYLDNPRKLKQITKRKRGRIN